MEKQNTEALVKLWSSLSLEVSHRVMGSVSGLDANKPLYLQVVWLGTLTWWSPSEGHSISKLGGDGVGSSGGCRPLFFLVGPMARLLVDREEVFGALRWRGLVPPVQRRYVWIEHAEGHS